MSKFILAVCLLSFTSISNALLHPKLIQKTHQGHAHSHLQVNVKYTTDLDVYNGFQKNPNWLPKATKHRQARAYFRNDWMYRIRSSIPEDSKEALEYYRLAAERGNANAQLKIALMYEDGEDLPQDYKEASRWYQLAAEQGHSGAQASLGLMYAVGNGVPDDYVMAYVWLTLAEANDEDVSAAKKILERVLRKEDKIESQRVTWKLMKEHPYIASF